MNLPLTRKFNWNRLIDAGFALALVLLLAVAWLSQRNMRTMLAFDSLESNSYIVIQGLDKLLSTVRDIETGRRGFIFTGDTSYLEPYRIAAREGNRELASLESATLDNPSQQSRLRHLDGLIRKMTACADLTIDIRRAHRPDVAGIAALIDRGKPIVDTIRAQTAAAIDEEKYLLQTRRAAKDAGMKAMVAALVAGTVLGLGILIAMFVLLKRELTRRKRSEVNFFAHQNRLNALIYERTKDLRDSEDKYRLLTESIADAFVSVDLLLRFTYWNKAAEEMSGIGAAEALGKKIVELLGDTEQTRKAAALCRECLVTMQPMRYEAETVYREQRHFLDVRFFPRQDGVSIIVDDCTARKTAEESLRESEASYRSLFDSMLDGVALCRMLYEDGRPRDFVYLSVNNAFETLTGLKDVTGRKISEIAPGIRESDPGLFEVYGRVALTGVPERIETYVKALDDWYSIAVYSPRKEHFVALFDVITARKKAEAALQRHAWELASANQSLEEFAYSISHDIRNALHSILACTEVLKIGPVVVDADGQTALDHITVSIERMGQIIVDLMSLSEIIKEEVTRSPCNLSDLAGAIAEELRLVDPSRNVAIVIEAGLVAGCDERLARILIHHLFTFAWRFTSRKSDALIEFGQKKDNGGTPTFFVRDNGAGFDMATIEKLFMPFQRVHARDEYAGSGIGLTIVKRIVEKHGGAIRVEAEKNKGSTFYFSLGKM